MGKTLEELLAEIEKKIKERKNQDTPTSETIPEPDATEYEKDFSVYETGATKSENTVFPESSLYSSASGLYEKGQTILDTYTVESEPIHGGMGSVWRVHHKGWNVDLAMKRPQTKLFRNEKQKENFIGECDAWINLGLHPNIVSCYYVREIDGVPTIFSEWMENRSLENHIRDGSLYGGSDREQRERLLDITIQFARGLLYAHDRGLIHQDVKPDNVLLSLNWDAKVADFGLAKARAQLTVLESENTVPDSGVTVIAPAGGYTPAYCSMEQMDGKPLTRRTDIYSWAVSVMEMYLGDRPWAFGVAAGYGCETYFPNCRVTMPEELKALLKKCMASEPEDRPHDFAEIESDLLKIYKSETGRDYPRPEPAAAADTAGSLNNRALSYLDMGEPAEAEKLWEKALKQSPNHMESCFNQGLYRWRSGLITDDVLINQLGQYENNAGRSCSQIVQAVQTESGSHERITKQPASAFFIGGTDRPDANCMSRDLRRALVKKDKNSYLLIEIRSDGAESILKEYYRPNVVSNSLLKIYSSYALSTDGSTAAFFFTEKKSGSGNQVGCYVEFVPLKGESEVIRFPDGWADGLNHDNYKLDCAASGMAFTADTDGVYVCLTTGSVLLLKRNGNIAAKRYFHYSSSFHLFVDTEKNQVVIGENNNSRFNDKLERNGLIHVLRTDNLELLHTFPGNDASILSVSCLHDNIYAFYEHAVRIWDRNTGKCRHSVFYSFFDDMGGVKAGWVYPDGTVYLQNGAHLNEKEFVFSLRYSGEGEKAPFLLNRIETVSDRSDRDREFDLLCQSAEKHILNGEQDRAFACLAQARQIHGYEEDREILDLNELAGKRRAKHGIRKLYLRGSWKGKFASLVPDTGELYIWSDKVSVVQIKTGLTAREADYHLFIDKKMCAGKDFLARDSASLIYVHGSSDFTQKEKLNLLPRSIPDDHIIALEAYPERDVLFAADEDGNAKLWDTVSWQCICELKTGMFNCKAAALNEDGTRVFITGTGRPGKGKKARQCYRIYDIRTGELFLDRALKTDEDLHEAVSAVWVGNKVLYRRGLDLLLFRDKSKSLINNLFLYDTDTGEETTLNIISSVTGIDAVPGCDWVISSRETSPECVFFRAGDPEVRQSFDLCTKLLKDVKISADGRYIIASVRDSQYDTVTLWEIDWIYD